MQFQFDIAACHTPASPPSPEGAGTPVDLLRQILELQKEHLAHLKATAAAHDPNARWRALVARWQEEFPGLPDTCRQALPILERAYGAIIASLVDELRQNTSDALDNEFALQDFLDRYGMRLGQLGNILNLVTPLAEAASPKETS